MDNKFKSNFTVQNLVSLFSIIIGTNYFLSYRWFDGFLRICGIDSLAIITLDDLTLLFVKNNISVIALTSIGFVGIFIIDFKSSEEEKPIDRIKKDFKNFIEDFKKNKWTKIISFVFALIVIFISYLYIYKPILEFPKPVLLVYYLIILFVVPFFYYLLTNKRKIIFWFQIFLMFTWANLFINYILEETKKSKAEEIIEISFNYENKRIETNDSLNFVMQSYKYTILKDSKEYYYFYDNTCIKNLKYCKRTKINNR